MSDRSVTERLRAIRTEAGVGTREMARRLGVSSSTYTHYENPSRFKGRYLPMEWAIRFADALEPEGVERQQIIALAGASRAEESESIDSRIARLSARRGEMILQLLQDLEAAEEADLARREKSGDESG